MLSTAAVVSSLIEDYMDTQRFLPDSDGKQHYPNQ